MGGSESFEQAGVTDPELDKYWFGLLSLAGWGFGERRGARKRRGVRFGNGLSRGYPDWRGESGI